MSPLDVIRVPFAVVGWCVDAVKKCSPAAGAGSAGIGPAGARADAPLTPEAAPPAGQPDQSGYGCGILYAIGVLEAERDRLEALAPGVKPFKTHMVVEINGLIQRLEAAVQAAAQPLLETGLDMGGLSCAEAAATFPQYTKHQQ